MPARERSKTRRGGAGEKKQQQSARGKTARRAGDKRDRNKETRGRSDRREGDEQEGDRGDRSGYGTRGFWSGSITFGLVSIPVDLHPAVRPNRVPLRALGPEGTPLSRRYFCSVEDRELDSDEIVKGYPLDDGAFMAVTDEEIESVAPDRSRDIELNQFVSLSEIDPMLFERPYVLAPSGKSTKAYHLLVDTIERRQRAGIATFVMRGKEHLAVIFAKEGILRATTLRFSNEVRTPRDVGLPDVAEAPKSLRLEMVEAIKRLEYDSLDRERLQDEDARLLRELAEHKRRLGRDVYESSDERTQEAMPDNVVDIMRLLKERIAEVRPGPSVKSTKKRATSQGGSDDLSRASKKELYERAKELDIEGRSGMSRDELIAAIRAAA